MTHRPYQPPPRRRTSPAAIVLLIGGVFVALAVLAVVVLAAVAGGSDGTLPAANAPAAKTSTHPAGTAATDARFTFRVTSVDTAIRLKTETGPIVSKGHFVQVWVAVTNRAAAARFVSADDQQLHAGGKTYSVDVDATVAVDKGPEIGLPEKISGGDTKTILLVFDVPESARPTTLEVHGSSTSGGQLLALPGH